MCKTTGIVSSEAEKRRLLLAAFVCGPSKSGKTTLAHAFSEVGFRVVSASAVIRSIGNERKWASNSRADLLAAGKRIRELDGDEWFADRLLGAAGHSRLVVFDGVRFPATVRWLKARAECGVLLYLDVPEIVRRARYAADPDKSIDFARLQQHPNETMFNELREMARKVVIGSPTDQEAKELAKAVLRYARRLGVKCMGQG